MKLDDTQTAEFIMEYYPPSPYNKDMERLTLERASKATEEEKELFITTSKPIENFFTQGQIHIPVHCPHCHTLSWYSIHQHSLVMVGLGGLYATCRCCRRTFLPVHHYGHKHRHTGLIAAAIILAICLMPCIIYVLTLLL